MNMNSRKRKASAVLVILKIFEDQENPKNVRKKRNEWVKPWLKRRDTHGFYSQLLSELRLEESEIYKNYLRMRPENYDELLFLIKDDITKSTTHLRDPIPPEIKLAITIRFLATGNSYQDLSTYFRVHKSTIGRFVPEVCDAIYRKLKDNFLKVHLKCFVLEQIQIS